MKFLIITTESLEVKKDYIVYIPDIHVPYTHLLEMELSISSFLTRKKHIIHKS